MIRPLNKRTYMQEYINDFDIWAPAKTSDILEQFTPGHWYLILSWNSQNDRGDTKKRWLLDTHVCLILLQTWNPQERWGTHKKTMTISATSFPDVIGFSLLLIYHYNRLGGFMMFHVVSWQRCPSYLSTCPEWGCKELFLPIDLAWLTSSCLLLIEVIYFTVLLVRFEDTLIAPPTQRVARDISVVRLPRLYFCLCEPLQTGSPNLEFLWV